MKPKIKFGFDFYTIVFYNSDLPYEEKSLEQIKSFVDFLLVWYWNFTNDEISQLWSIVKKEFTQYAVNIRLIENQLIEYLVKDKKMSKTFQENLLMVYFFGLQKDNSLLNYIRMFSSRLNFSGQEYDQLYRNASVKSGMIKLVVKDFQTSQKI